MLSFMGWRVAFFTLFLASCVSPVSRTPSSLRWPRLPERAFLKGDVMYQSQTSTHRGSFLLRYDPDSVTFLVRGILGFSRSYRGTVQDAPVEIQALLSLVHPEFCGMNEICTPAGTLRVEGRHLPEKMEIPGLLLVRILEWKRVQGYDIPGAWLFEGKEGSGKVSITSVRFPDIP